MRSMLLLRSVWRRVCRVLLLGALFCLFPSEVQAQQFKQRSVLAKPAKTKINKTTHREDAIIVKFKDDLPMRVVGANLHPRGFSDSRLFSLLAKLAGGGAKWRPIHGIPVAKLEEMRRNG